MRVNDSTVVPKIARHCRSIRCIVQPRGQSCADPRPGCRLSLRLTLSDHFYTPTLRPKSPRRGDDRVSGTDADRHDDIYHIGSSGFCCNADRAEMADLNALRLSLPHRRVERVSISDFGSQSTWDFEAVATGLSANAPGDIMSATHQSLRL